jgi:hypothetical protein
VGGRFWIDGGDELRDDLFERRAALHQRAYLRHRSLGHDSPAMQDDDRSAQAFDVIEQV